MNKTHQEWKDRWEKNYTVSKEYKDFSKHGIVEGKLYHYHPTFERYLYNKWRYPNKNDRVLEIGSSAGNLMSQFLHKVDEIHGVDISSIAVRRGRKRYEKFNNVFFHDDTDLMNLDGLFDIIYSITVFQHLPREFTQTYLDQAFHKLHPEGCLFFNVLSGIQDKNEAILDQDADLCQPAIGFSEEDITLRCVNAGFKKIETERMDVGAKDNAYWWTWVRCGK